MQKYIYKYMIINRNTVVFLLIIMTRNPPRSLETEEKTQGYSSLTEASISLAFFTTRNYNSHARSVFMAV